jgi:hypothetical protein
MSIKMKNILPCDEAHHVCDKAQYKEASLWEKSKLYFHLVFCKCCRKYTNNNKKLSTTIHKAKVTCLDHKCKEAMKLEFEKALKDQLK